MTDRKRIFIAPILMAMMAVITGAGNAPEKNGGLEGQWGGERLNLTVGPAGAVLRSDCADGRINGPFTPDGRGGFAASGRFDALRPGAQLVDEGPGDGIADTAHFTANVVADRMQLMVTKPGSPPRQFTLARGKTVKLIRCF